MQIILYTLCKYAIFNMHCCERIDTKRNTFKTPIGKFKDVAPNL